MAEKLVSHSSVDTLGKNLGPDTSYFTRRFSSKIREQTSQTQEGNQSFRPGAMGKNTKSNSEI